MSEIRADTTSNMLLAADNQSFANAVMGAIEEAGLNGKLSFNTGSGTTVRITVPDRSEPGRFHRNPSNSQPSFQ